MTISVIHTTAANTLTVTIPATTARNCLVVCVMSFSSTAAGSVTGVTLGGAADHFAQTVAGHGTNGTNLHADAFIWADPDCAGGQTSLVISGTNLAVDSADGGVVVYEAPGLALSAVADKTSSGGAASGTSWSSGATATTTQAAELWVGCGDVAGPSSPGGWTNTITTGSNGIAGFQVASAKGAATYNGTQASTAWAAAVATFKGASLVALPPPRSPAAMFRASYY